MYTCNVTCTCTRTLNKYCICIVQMVSYVHVQGSTSVRHRCMQVQVDETFCRRRAVEWCCLRSSCCVQRSSADCESICSVFLNALAGLGPHIPLRGCRGRGRCSCRRRGRNSIWFATDQTHSRPESFRFPFPFRFRLASASFELVWRSVKEFNGMEWSCMKFKSSFIASSSSSLNGLIRSAVALALLLLVILHPPVCIKNVCMYY